MKKLLTLSLLSLSICSVSDGHSEGAFNTLFVKAADVDRYVTYMKNNPAVFEQTGVDVAGVCVTTSGQSYPGQMFVWNAFPSTEVAMNASTFYDPFKANSSFQRLREPMFTATFVPLKAFELDPGFERVWKVRLNDWKSYDHTIESKTVDQARLDFKDFCKENNLENLYKSDTDLLNFILFTKESKDFYTKSSVVSMNDLIELQEGFGIYMSD